ncbi:hypothetical protein SISNIDRAFT_438421 [Sistotremastrum niveocremeum HHB9708]|uniref:Integral membrane protein n=2 Tax=Sistotremastraceae TaxID=3402574 RepID=A0A164XDJ2_9AGAM|nr:hypothetical protein SISNIDRAFT_438421 [Sistotremastrum niveocremeum HHB9708]KZT41413.1 hypothetical protein SISSUDRAFT_1000925 [Sistotremastrum suecicum HHB10207 ss-3]
MGWRLALGFAGLLLARLSRAYEIPISDTDDTRQACSGMWGGKNAHINVTFDAESQGQLAMVIYRWSDVSMLGKVTSESDDTLPKTYVCTSDAVRGGFCDNAQLGHFIIDLEPGVSLNETSFWSNRVAFGEPPSNNMPDSSLPNEDLALPPDSSLSEDSPPTTPEESAPAPEESEEEESPADKGFWDNPDGNVLPEDDDVEDDGPTNWKRNLQRRQDGSSDIWWYKEPIMYPVTKTGYYCVAIVPVTIVDGRPTGDTNVPFHPQYSGVILFRNTFEGKLPATDYPKVGFYFFLFVTYLVLGGVWAYTCWKQREQLLPIQNYLSALVALLVIEMLSSWAYYRYLNSHGTGVVAVVFLFVVAILDAARNALSLLLLLIVSLGLSVVRESLGPTMMRCWILAAAHFVFGVLYAVGIVELELESTTALVLLLFVIPLAFTLSGFLLWIMYALNRTIAELAARKQTYKLTMFKRLHFILLGTVFVIFLFFIVSSMSFADRLGENYANDTWKTRWWLLDGWLALLYLGVFGSIAYLWRPTEHNRRLAMSEELAQEDAEDYDLEGLQRRADREDDDVTLVGDRRQPRHERVGEDEVVFDIGDAHDSDEEDDKRHTSVPRTGSTSPHAGDEETAGLIQQGYRRQPGDKDD